MSRIFQRLSLFRALRGAMPAALALWPSPLLAEEAPATPGETDSDATIDAAPEPAPSAPPEGAIPATPAPTPAPPEPAVAATNLPAAATNLRAAAATPQARKAPSPEAPSEPEASETDSLLKNAGYELTPGVSFLPFRSDFVFSGYLQGQYESHQDSQDQLRQGGTLLNQDRFLLRRGRFKITRDWEWAQIVLELDANTTKGPAVRAQKAELSLVYGRSRDQDQPPLAELTVGQFDLPFGFEMPYVPKVRWFMERTQASRALFPGEPDVGARFSGGVGFARYSVAITNGEPLDEKTPYVLQDPNRNKDVTGRLGAVAKPSRSFVVAGGISYNRGKGFSPGNDATKTSVQWSDTNGNGKVDPNAAELNGLVGVAKTSTNFARWAVGADLELLLRTGLGWSMLYGEVAAASNLDRGLFIADPVLTGQDVRELGYYVAFTQEVTRYGIVGFRYDFYDPNADVTDQRRGKILPASQAIKTCSPLAGLVLPGRARLLFQYDVVRDFLGRNRLGVPTDFSNDQWTLRLQVNL